jgi:hypothetical protein
MKRSNEKPEIYKKLKKRFGVKWNDGLIITYGDTTYSKERIHRIKYVHEKVHSKRQLRMGVEDWWDKYLKDKDFRLNEELLAYRKEVEWIYKQGIDKDFRTAVIEGMATDLSSKMYGEIISYEDALRAITE